MGWSRFASLPLGVEITDRYVSFVAAEHGVHGLRVRCSGSATVPDDTAVPLDVRLAKSLRDALANGRLRERRCVLAAPAEMVSFSLFALSPRVRGAEARRAARLEVDATSNIPGTDRVFSLDAVPGEDAAVLSIARKSGVERVVRIARDAGLRPCAVDVPAFAWKRALPAIDALIDVSADRGCLIVFGKTLPSIYRYASGMSDAGILGETRSRLSDARRDGHCDVRTIAVFAKSERSKTLAAALGSYGYDAGPVLLIGHENPPWALALGLAAWSGCFEGMPP